MVSHDEVQKQLQAIGVEFHFWGRSEMHELHKILVPNETIQHCLNGRYEGGFAMLCITDQRIILIDKKPFYLTLEDVRYDMVSEVDFNLRLIDATIILCTVNKKMRFTTWRVGHVRAATAYIQNRVMEFRQQHMMPAQEPVAVDPMQNYLVTQNEPEDKPKEIAGVLTGQPVKAIEHRVINPYTRVPLMMRRRLSRYYS